MSLKPLSSLFEQTLKHLTSQPESTAGFALVWSHAVGEAAAHNSRVVEFRHGTLVVETVDETWADALRQQHDGFVAKLNALSGKNRVHRIDFKAR